MRRESTALVLLLAGVTSQVLFIFGVLYFNTYSEFQCHTKKKEILCAKARPSKCPFNYAFIEWPWYAQTCLNWDILVIIKLQILEETSLSIRTNSKISILQAPFKNTDQIVATGVKRPAPPALPT